MVFGGYLLKTQRLLGDAVVTQLKADDLQRCHEMGGFDTPVGGGWAFVGGERYPSALSTHHRYGGGGSSAHGGQAA